MGPIVFYIHAKNREDPCSRLGVKCKEVKKHLFWTQQSLPNNLGLRLFSEKTTGSDNGPYCSLPPCKKFGRSLEPLWRKGKNGQITPF